MNIQYLGPFIAFLSCSQNPSSMSIRIRKRSGPQLRVPRALFMWSYKGKLGRIFSSAPKPILNLNFFSFPQLLTDNHRRCSMDEHVAR